MFVKLPKLTGRPESFEAIPGSALASLLSPYKGYVVIVNPFSPYQLPNLTFPDNRDVIYKIVNNSTGNIQINRCGYSVLYGSLVVRCDLPEIVDTLTPNTTAFYKSFIPFPGPDGGTALYYNSWILYSKFPTNGRFFIKSAK